MAGKIGVLTSRRYQMQTKFASPTDRAPVESWVQPTNQPPHRNFAAKVAGFAAAIVAGAFFFGTPPLTEEKPQGDGSSPQLLVFKVKSQQTANQQAVFYGAPPLTEEPPQGLGAVPPLLTFKSPKYSKAALEPAVSWSTFTPVSAPILSFDWLPQTNQPISRKVYHPSQQTAEFFVSVDDFPLNSDLGQVQRTKSSRDYAYFFYGTPSLNEEPPQGDGSKQDLLLFKDPRLSRAALEPSVSWSTFTPSVAPALSFDWLPQTDEPLKRVKTNNDYAYLFYDPSFAPEVVSADKFVQPTNQPYPYKKYLLTANQQATFWNTSTAAEVVSADKFVQPISQPYPYKKVQSTAEQQAAFWNTSTQAEVVTVDKFGQPTNQPYPYKKYELTSNQSYFFYGAETVSVDKFTPQYPDQHLQKKYLSAALQQSFTWAIPQAPEAVSADKFIQPTNQPYPYKRSLSASNQPYFFWSTFTPAATPAVVTGWTPYYPDLVNPKRYLLTSEQQATFWNTSTSPENVSVDKFGQPISQPYPYKKILGTANQQTVFSDGLESIVVDKFAQQTNQPYPYKKSLFVGHVPFFTYIGPPLKEEPPQGEGSKPTLLSFKVRNYIAANQQTSVFQEIDSSDWIPETEQPQNRKKPVNPETYVWTTFTPIVSTFFNVSWIQPTEQPFPSKKLLITALQQSTFGPPSATSITFTNLPLLGSGEVLTDFGSGGFTSNVSGIGTVLQSSTGVGLTTVPAIGSGIVIFPAVPVPPIPDIDNGTEASWHQMISQPTPGRKYLVANQEAAFWNTSNQPEVVTADKFVQAISQPTLSKKYLATKNQEATFKSPEVVTADKFVQPISQPVNKKKAHLASNQVSFFMCHPLFG